MRLTDHLAVLAFAVATATATGADAASIFLTGHDPDFHAVDDVGAQHINQAAISFILDPTYNVFASGGNDKFLFVQGDSTTIPAGHRNGVVGLTNSGYTEGTDFVTATASTLESQLALLGTDYAGIVIGSDFGGLLSQAELDILNAHSSDIIDFLNAGGGLYAMAESGGGSGLTTGGWFGYLPFLVSSTIANQTESGFSVTAYGASIGLTDADVNGNYSHNIFNGSFGLNVVDYDAAGRIMSLAGRGTVDPGGGVSDVPLPAGLPLLVGGLGLLGLVRRRRERS